jgi:hypothetical protein
MNSIRITSRNLEEFLLSCLPRDHRSAHFQQQLERCPEAVIRRVGSLSLSSGAAFVARELLVAAG